MEEAKTAGRPLKEINKKDFESLLSIQCTLREVTAFFDMKLGGCSEDTIQRWCKRTYGKNFAAVASKMYEVGKISLRRAQFRLAEKSAAMAIFLGKNLLGQTDKDYWQRRQDEKALELKERQVEQGEF